MVKKSAARKIKDALLTKQTSVVIKKRDYLSLGWTTLNLACADYAFGGLRPGHAYLVCGPSGGGKTAILNTVMAQACINPFYEDYKIVYDNSEDGNLFDLASWFSSSVEERILPPDRDKQGTPTFSRTPQDMYYYMNKWMDKGPCIFIEDSMDALMDQEEKDVYAAELKARDGGKDAKGSMGAEKAKANYKGYRYSLSRIKETKSIVIIVAHQKEKIGSFGFGDKRDRTGGKAMKFFATLEMWTKPVGTIKREYAAKKSLQVGIELEVDIKKNRNTGKQRTVWAPIYNDSGIGDIDSCLEFLIDTNAWPYKAGCVTAKEFKFTGRKEAFIKSIKSKEDLKKLRLIVRDVWHGVEAKVAVERFSEYRE